VSGRRHDRDLFGTLGAVALSKLAHWNTSISILAILIAFIFSAIVGCSSASGRRGVLPHWILS